MIGLLIHKNHGDINLILNESRKTFDKIFTINDFKYEERTILLIFEKDINSIDISRFDFVEYVFHKQYTEYLDMAQCTSRFGFHTDLYIPPARTGDSSIDKKAIQDAESHLALEDLSVLLTNELQTDVTRNIYVAELEKIKKSLEKDLYSMDIYELAKAYEISKDHKEIITIATIIYTMKWGKPVSKNGYEYNYKPETYWQASTYGNPNFHVHHDMDYYFEEFPNMKKQWIKSLKTRCRNIIKEELGLFRITGFIQFLRDKYIEENTSIIEYKQNDSSISEIDISEAEIPF